MTVLALLSLIAAVLCYSIRELYYHRKLKWMDDDFGFWGKYSDVRKYASIEKGKFSPPKNLYYKLTGLKYREKFPLAGSLLIWTTDGVHLLQAIMFIFLSLSISAALSLENWKQYLAVYIGIHAIHFVTYRVLQR